ncbi:CaiB/BaiF CoA transferase family protein [Paraburkholderia sabiae]|uniref:CaiB/BaiF CoA-transferase family protein n=1 Tax=Paraburkholderia sabiae TaxID=273251 RepID=A0ABU9QIC6_9BURK|nr:CaiB/BaiF CoA-transferase family protein [Paraburkholderia sabiae]WJZ77432.1 CaiB/BaiF CoA-transferase family protein [Paraburkholderia sabiae]CAD6557800.1 Acetyl-CoA:oxalate CoA-transferase [Paraburkholderia sabiae]
MSDQSGATAALPLHGKRIVSFCHFLQGPAAVQYLADLGAEVVKVEPISGAYERHWSGADLYVDETSVFFLAANRNCRSLAVDLKSAEGRQVVEKLIANADVVIQNYRPGVLERLGFGFEDCKRLKADIIYAAATGFGSSGPLVEKPGQDLLIQARCGLAAATGSSPTPVGGAVIDQHGAALLAMGVLAALVKRAATGQGGLVEGNLLNAGIDLQMEGITSFLTGKFDTDRFTRHPRLATWLHQAPYGLYQLADSAIVLPLTDAKVLAEALDSEPLRQLSDIDLYSERDRYADALQEVLRTRSFDEVAGPLDAHGVWFAKVQTYGDLRNDPQIQHNRVFRSVDINGSEVVLVNHPVRYDGQVLPLRRLALRPGQDTREILSELGYDEADVVTLEAHKAIRSGERRDWQEQSGQ